MHLDMRRVHLIEVARRSRNGDDTELLGRLDNTLADVESIICDLGDVRALLIDPITDFAGDISLYKEDQVRRLLGPIGQMAARYSFAVINVPASYQRQQEEAAPAHPWQRWARQYLALGADGWKEPGHGAQVLDDGES